MPEFGRILCPVDFSEFSRHAIDHAVALAHWSGGSVVALHVVTPVPFSDPLMSSAEVFSSEDADRVCSELAGFVAEEGGPVPIECRVAEASSAAAAICAEAEKIPADLLVMGTHGRTGFERLVLGSVTERVVRRDRCPVLTVPERLPDAVPMGAVAFARILCPVDFSPASIKALELAQSLADDAKAEVIVLHVLEPMALYEPMIAGSPAVYDIEQAAREGITTRLHELTAGRNRAREVVATGKPYQEILRVAADEKADLIVIGSHGGAAGVFAFGSTTNHVTRAAACPVLSVRA
jgi:nucleotide-binding universal stress UspA family protein